MDTIVYHGDCPDGFCAAFIVSKDHPQATLVPATYGKPLDDSVFRGKDLLVVDFSWKRDETLRIASLAKSIRILDHHKTAEAELAGLDFCTFDISRSGAQMAWDWFYPESVYARPWYVEYVADRDLWQWKLRESKAVNAFIMTLPHTTSAWSVLDTMTVDDAIIVGRGARAQVDHYVEKVCAQAYAGVWNNHTLRIVNAPYPNISDVCGQLCVDGAAVGVGWFVRGDGLMQFSLRSVGNTVDVSALAQTQGGGGHKNAAGFQLPFQAGLDLLQSWQSV